ncbi:hypothetical protein QYE76_003533 [Lolium multiflorum]|uniref:CCHC-type domain-containing protein n=1 Tax=Lolium multiflorum TaxID=4521 RepID=A0AAD8RNW4_LOLMU|nr:hypothetical protein QYE76_003533 [Lolium multiflorum]
MGKPRDTKIAILPSTTRKGTTLSTSAALDSPSVISKLVSPPQASNAGTSAESENSSHNCDDASAVLDNDGSLGSFLDATIARSRQIENTETPNENAATPVNSPESVEYSSDDLDEDYVELDDDFIEKCNATTDARKIKKLLAEHAVRYKLSPDPKFATSPINIKDKDYDFSLDLSHIAIVEKTPFCGTEKESVVEHMIELSTLSSLFSDDVKMRTYFVAKIFPFSLKDDAKTWYNNLPPGSIKSPIDLRDVFFRKYFPASAQHAALQRIYNFDQEDGEKLPEAWARFCSLIRAQPDHDLEKHDLLDIFYSGLTIESRAYLDSCAGCVFRKRTPDDAEELLAKIGRNHDDWSTPEPTPTPILKKRGMIKLNDEDMREAKKSLKEKGIKPEDVKNLPPIEDLCKITPPSSMIEDPLYPEGHPKRVEQDSQLIKTSAPSKKKKKKHKNVVESSEPVNDPNSISISDAETESGNEHDKDNDKDDTPDKEEVEEEPKKHAKNKKYTKEDFIAEKHDMASSINFNQFLEKEKLKSNGSNFTDWFRHVRIFLNGGNLQYVLDAPLGDPPAETETDEVKNVYMTRKTRYSQVQCAILCSLESDLQKRFEHHDPHELIKELKTIFETHAAVECYEASKHFFSCMMEEGSSISEHMLVMTGHAKKLSDLGIVIPNRLGINRVLQSLPPSYKNFVMNYNMQNMNKEFPELFGMLKAAEIEIKKEHQVLMVNKTTSFKKQGKSKGKNKKSGKKAATPPVKPKSGPKPDAECYYCKEKGHWKRNCSKYLADLKSGLVKKKKEVPENVPVPPTPATEEANDNDHETSNETATEPRRSTRDRATPDWYDPCLNVMIVDNNDEDPATYEEAMMSPDSNKWQEAMKSEMGSMYDNKVWTLVDLPDSRKAVENKWIFKRKTDADGNITVYKARLVAKGFRQIQGVDYDETFSPVAKLKSVRILLAIAAFFDYEIWQMDVKTAFLNGDIEEELYMVQPKGFVDPKNADKVCKLQRSIYGLKQASRSWNRRFDKVIKDFGFIQCHGEACIYKKVSGSSVAFLILYVDDILLIGNDIELLSSVKGYLNNSFSMKDLGEASYILGIKIYRDRSRRLIGLSQSTYLDKILKKFRMDESKKGFLPMLPGKVLSKTQGPATAEERERMSQIPYASAVGSIMYAMLCTRPDIAHAVSLTSRYQSDPGMEHWTAVKNILKYLKRTKDMFLCYGGDQELVVTSYTDASWNTDPDDSKSQSGYVFILNGAAVSWASSKQCTVAKSSTESEYIAASEASSAVWMKRFIVELGVVPSALDPFVIYCDNMGAIANAQEPRSHKRLKHIKLRYHSIREYIEDGEVKICKVHTDLNVADPLTKALPRAKHDQHQNAMGVRYITM